MLGKLCSEKIHLIALGPLNVVCFSHPITGTRKRCAPFPHKCPHSLNSMLGIQLKGFHGANNYGLWISSVFSLLLFSSHSFCIITCRTSPRSSFSLALYSNIPHSTRPPSANLLKFIVHEMQEIQRKPGLYQEFKNCFLN